MTTFDRAALLLLAIGWALALVVPWNHSIVPYMGPALCFAFMGWWMWWRLRGGGRHE